MGLQTAGGSNSVKKSYQNLRESAAVAREMLIAGAAEFWKVPAGKCRTEKSMVLGPGSRSLSFVETVPYAEKQPVPENPPLKPDSELKYIGKATKVMDAREIGMGKTIFGMDAMPENVHFAVMIRCPVYQGKLKSFDSTAAKAMPGVVDVLKVGDKIAVVAKNTWFAINASWVVSVEWDEGANAGADTVRDPDRRTLPMSERISYAMPAVIEEKWYNPATKVFQSPHRDLLLSACAALPATARLIAAQTARRRLHPVRALPPHPATR